MPSADPSIVYPIITRMEIETECISVQSRRTVQVGNLQDDGDQPTVLGHSGSLPRSSPIDCMPSKRLGV